MAIVNPRSQAQNRALDQAAQNAGLPAWNWKAAENEAVFRAAQSAGEAAEAARRAQGGRGYLSAAPALGMGVEAGSRGDYETPDPSLSFSTDGAGGVTPLQVQSTSPGGLPAVLDQSKAEYWQRADMQAWANASEGNRKLAERAMARAGYKPQAGAPSGEVGGIGPVADGQAYGRQLQDLQGTRGIGPVANGDTYAQMLNMPQQQAPITPTQGIGPIADGDAYGAQLEAMQGTTGMGPLADPQTYGAMLTGADEQRRRAAALSNSYVRAIQSRGYQEAIQQHGMGLG